MKCRCQYCRDAMSSSLAERRATGRDAPRVPRHRHTGGHIDGQWFRIQVFYPAVQAVGIPFKFTPKSMCDAHASWILAGGADIQVAKERLGDGSITTTEQYLGTLPGAEPPTPPSTTSADRAVPQHEFDTEAAAQGKKPDMAELLKMMAVSEGLPNAFNDSASFD